MKNNHADIIEYIKTLLKNEWIRTSPYKTKLVSIVHRLEDNVFKLAVVGEFSSGKSTFLNALMRKHILKSATEETTSVITEIENMAENSMPDHIDIHYLDGTIKEDVPISEIDTYTTKKGNYQENISKVVIKCHLSNTDFPVCFIDTPGLNGMTAGLREKTLELMQNAHACIYLMGDRGLDASDSDFIKRICEYQRNIIFVQNFIDKLKPEEDENLENKIESQQKTLCSILGSDIKYSVVGVSARQALFALDMTQNEFEHKALTENFRKELFKTSNFEGILTKIDELIAEQCQKKDTLKILDVCLNDIKESIAEEIKVVDEKWSESNNGRAKKSNEELLKKLNADKDERRKALEDFIVSECTEIGIAVKNEIENILSEDIIESIKTEMNSKKEINTLEEYINKELGKIVSNFVDKADFSKNKILELHFSNILTQATNKVENDYEIEIISENTYAFSQENSDFKKPDFEFVLENKAIESLEKQIDNYKNRNIEIENKIKNKEDDLCSISERIEEERKKKQELENEHAARITDMGCRPAIEYIEYIEKYTEPRGGLGIIDFFLGPEEKYRKCVKTDDSARKYWDKRKGAIDFEYKRKINAIQNGLRDLTYSLQDCKDIIEQLKDERHRNDIRQAEAQEDLKNEEDMLKQKKKQVKTEYMNNLKKSVAKRLENYIFGDNGIIQIMADHCKKTIRKNRKILIEYALRIFDEGFEKKVQSINNRIAEISRLKPEDLNDLMTQILEVKHKVEQKL